MNYVKAKARLLKAKKNVTWPKLKYPTTEVYEGITIHTKAWFNGDCMICGIDNRGEDRAIGHESCWIAIGTNVYRKAIYQAFRAKYYRMYPHLGDWKDVICNWHLDNFYQVYSCGQP